MNLVFSSRLTDEPGWRNWQTQRTQNPHRHFPHTTVSSLWPHEQRGSRIVTIVTSVGVDTTVKCGVPRVAKAGTKSGTHIRGLFNREVRRRAGAGRGSRTPT